MKAALVALCSCASALNAPAPVQRVRALAPRMSAADGMEGAAHETGFTTWDPLGLADLGSPATLAWMRHAELKHGRVAMAAFTGWLVATGNQLAIKNGHEGVHFPGYISPFQTGTTFADIAAAGGPMEQWQAVPEVGKLQIIGAIFIIEHQSEWKLKPHYMAGGVPGDLKGLKSFWDPIGLTKKLDSKQLQRQRLSELKNGRAAMIGIIGCLLAGNMPPLAIPVPIEWLPGASITEPFGTFASYH